MTENPMDQNSSDASENGAPEEDAVPEETTAQAEEIVLDEPEAVTPEAEATTSETDAPPAEETPAAEAASPESTDEPVEVEAELAAAVEEALEGVEEDEVLDEWIPGEWFVVHTYAGYENKVKVDLETRVASMNMEDAIYEVVIPMEEVTEVKNGKKQLVQRKVFPGYLLVRMELNDDSWYVVRNTPGVTGFVGSANKPIPLSEKEVDKILKRGKPGEEAVAAADRPRAEWQAGDSVRVTQGPFANFQGLVSEVDEERTKVKVLVNIFGRETPVELAFDQIAKV
jgi:transcription termination/antitermination protein NusG